jgi:tetratricopeptide (TPR) repeat protein
MRVKPEKEEEELKKSLSYYMKVLEQDDGNIYAALGTANVLGEYGKVDEAQEIYKVLRENAPQIHHPFINSALLLNS